MKGLYNGRDTLDVYIMKHVLKTKKPNYKDLCKLKIYNRLYTDEIPDFIAKYHPSYDVDGMKVFKCRWMYFNTAKEIVSECGLNSRDDIKVHLHIFRVDFSIALDKALESGDYDHIVGKQH